MKIKEGGVMDIKESKELSFDTQDFPKEVWVFDADNLDQGTEISHLMMSHAEQYTKDELLEICRQASMVIDQLRAELAKAQAVPEKDAIIQKLSDQLYEQEMKASAARVLCETACELLDDYAHQDAMVILNDLEQAMKEPAND